MRRADDFTPATASARRRGSRYPTSTSDAPGTTSSARGTSSTARGATATARTPGCPAGRYLHHVPSCVIVVYDARAVIEGRLSEAPQRVVLVAFRRSRGCKQHATKHHDERANPRFPPHDSDCTRRLSCCQAEDPFRTVSATARPLRRCFSTSSTKRP